MMNEWNQIAVPEELDRMIDANMKRLRAGQREKKRKSRLRKGMAAAAVLTCSTIFCVKNPASAAKLPVIGHIFERMQDSYSYGGDYSGIGKPLEEPLAADQTEQTGEKVDAASGYTQTVGGLTISLSEIYCNDQAIYITMQMKSEEPFPKIAGNWQCFTEETYSFNPSVQMDALVIEGELLDDYTYAGMMRLDLNQKTGDDSEWIQAIRQAQEAGKDPDVSTDGELYTKYMKRVTVPDTFTLDLKLERLTGTLEDAEPVGFDKTEEELSAMSDGEWKTYMKEWETAHRNEPGSLEKTYEGAWNFTLDVQKDLSETQVVEINDRNEDGIGFEKIVMDRFEITMYDTYKDPELSYDYFPVILDADGRLMDYGSGSSVNTVAINDRDVSKVDLFLVDYDLWMDELKGDYWRQEDAATEDGRTYRELLLEKCAYHTEVVFEEQ